MRLRLRVPMLLLGALCASALTAGCGDGALGEPAAPGRPDARVDGGGATPDVRSDTGLPPPSGMGDPDGGADGGAVRARTTTLEGGVLRVDGKPFTIRAVGWNPIPVGGVHPNGLDYAGYVAQDGDLMRAAGINAVRTYSTITDRGVLDALYARGIYVLNSVYAWGGDDAEAAGARVRAVADHPAILMWLVGNEWNYNGLYVGMSHAASLQRVKEVIAVVREEDAGHPIATVYGELPDTDTLAALPEVDAWGINAYRGISFGNLFETWTARSAKPMFLAEFGADAWNAKMAREDQQAQADATVALVREIAAHAAATGSGTCLGGALFEWADEWWKDDSGSPNMQDVGGVAPGGGPYPDQVFNEEWWGLVAVDRTPRLAYRALVTEWGM